MSYEIVKGVKIKDNKVLIKSACNNVTPRTYEWWESKVFSDCLKEKGKKEAELLIFKEYENGNMHAGTDNKYARALKRLIYLPEYAQYDWRNDAPEEKRNSKEFDNLLYKTLNTKTPTGKFIVKQKRAL